MWGRVPGSSAERGICQRFCLGPGQADIAQKVVIQPPQIAAGTGVGGQHQQGLQGAGGAQPQSGKITVGHHHTSIGFGDAVGLLHHDA